MSRTHDFPAHGMAEVRMACGTCGREQWVTVRFEWLDEDPCFAKLAAEKSDWRYTHDDYVCSEKCEREWWGSA